MTFLLLLISRKKKLESLSRLVCYYFVCPMARLRKPLSEWIRPSQSFGHPQPLKIDALAAAGNSAIADDYLIPALQIASSIADQICQAEEESGRSHTPGSEDG